MLCMAFNCCYSCSLLSIALRCRLSVLRDDSSSDQSQPTWWFKQIDRVLQWSATFSINESLFNWPAFIVCLVFSNSNTSSTKNIKIQLDTVRTSSTPSTIYVLSIQFKLNNPVSRRMTMSVYPWYLDIGSDYGSKTRVRIFMHNNSKGPFR